MIRLVELCTSPGRRKLAAALATVAALVVVGLGACALLLVVPEPAYPHVVTLALATQGSAVAALGALVGGNAMEHRAHRVPPPKGSPNASP